MSVFQNFRRCQFCNISETIRKCQFPKMPKMSVFQNVRNWLFLVFLYHFRSRVLVHETLLIRRYNVKLQMWSKYIRPLTQVNAQASVEWICRQLFEHLSARQWPEVQVWNLKSNDLRLECIGRRVTRRVYIKPRRDLNHFKMNWFLEYTRMTPLKYIFIK